MNGFELNKIFAAVLVALIMAMLGTLLAEFLMPFEKHIKIILDLPTEKQAAATTEEKLPNIIPFLQKAKLENGQKIAEKKCAQCHTFTKDGANKIGPNLWNIIGRKVSSLANFAYSAAFRSQTHNWDYEKLSAYLHNPRKMIEGTKMSFAGIKNNQERADVIEYLRSISENPPPANPS